MLENVLSISSEQIDQLVCDNTVLCQIEEKNGNLAPKLSKKHMNPCLEALKCEEKMAIQ